ncbi:MAG: Cof-type HAD-IIB family hydrolase [Solobacterium sp.]|nr:Cof-type HAD-IIB family hydrolase [Solobacterium sp.]
MEKKNIRFIVCDVDNTVIPAGENALSERTRRAFHKAIDKGIHVMINTGRHYTFLQKSLFDDLPMDMIGTINGACLSRRDGSVIAKHPMTGEHMRAITDICLQNGIGLGFKFEDRIVTYANNDRFMNGYLLSDQDLAPLILNDCEKRTHHETAGYPLGTFIVCRDSELGPFEELRREFEFAWSFRNGFDVFLREINKALSVEAALKEYGLAWDNVIAFGDAGNDTAFVEKAAIGVAMGNAKDGLKNKADIIAPDCRDDGAAAVLEELGII